MNLLITIEGLPPLSELGDKLKIQVMPQEGPSLIAQTEVWAKNEMKQRAEWQVRAEQAESECAQWDVTCEAWRSGCKAAQAEVAALREELAQSLAVIERCQQAARDLVAHPSLPQEIRDLVEPFADGLPDGGAL